MKFKIGDIVAHNEQVYEVYEDVYSDSDNYLLKTTKPDFPSQLIYKLVHEKNLKIATSIEKHNFLLNKNKNN